jgi:broad specificity phosphatase PhoE
LRANDATFFSLDAEATRLREELAMHVLQDALAWLRDGGGVAILDATNTTRARRALILRTVSASEPQPPVIFVESICNDPHVLQSNLLQKVMNSPDYAGMPIPDALADLQRRIAQYEARYATIEDEEDEGKISFIRLVDFKKLVCVNIPPLPVAFSIVTFLMVLHVGARSIFLVRAGQCTDDLVRIKVAREGELQERLAQLSAAATTAQESQAVSELQGLANKPIFQQVSRIDPQLASSALSAGLTLNENGAHFAHMMSDFILRRVCGGRLRQGGASPFAAHTTGSSGAQPSQTTQHRHTATIKRLSIDDSVPPRRISLAEATDEDSAAAATAEHAGASASSAAQGEVIDDVSGLVRKVKVRRRPADGGSANSGNGFGGSAAPAASNSAAAANDSAETVDDDDENVVLTSVRVITGHYHKTHDSATSTSAAQASSTVASSARPPVVVTHAAAAAAALTDDEDELLVFEAEPVVYASLLPRTLETAAPLVKRLAEARGIPASKVLQATPALNPMSTGIAMGVPLQHLKTSFPEEWAAFQNAPHKATHRITGGESLADVVARLQNFVIEIERQRKPVVIVSHLSTLQVLYAYFRGIPLEKLGDNLEPIPLHHAIEFRAHQYGWIEKRYQFAGGAEEVITSSFHATTAAAP